MARGGEREQVLAVNTSTSALPFVRPETRATILYGRPLGARKHKKTIEPLGVRNPSYAVPAGKLREGETYSVNVKLIAQMIPVHLIPAIQESGFDYGMTPRELAENVVEGAMMLHERDMTVTYNPNGKKYLRIQIPIKIPNNNSNNECYIEWIECDQRIYWKEGESMTFDVEKLHQGSNQSDQSMEFLYIDVNPEVELE